MTDTAPLAQPGRKIKMLSMLLVVCLAAGGGAYWYNAKASQAKLAAGGKNRPMPVVVVEAKTQDVEVFLSSLGTVTPMSSVTVRSRVDGQLMQVLFREGQMVKAGELLLVIDSRPFQVQLAQAEGQLKRDSALLENARLDLKRYSDLMAQGAIARQSYDTQLSLVHQYEGTVATDKATADNARLQITYSRITAPVSGQVGLRAVDPGNMVHASDASGLLVVNQIAPISVLFTLPEDQLPRVLEKLRAGEKLRVDAYDREQSKKLAQGELSSMDNQIDTGTGTVRLKASFQNTQGELYPNQFVNAKLLLETLKNAVVVPAAAVQRGQQGTYVFVVDAQNVAATRPVSVGESGDGQSVILSGLAVGEKVVVDGADRLRDGAPVEIKTPGPKAEGQAAAKPGEGQPQAAQNATASPPAPRQTSRPDAKPDSQAVSRQASQPDAHQASQGASQPADAGKTAPPHKPAQKPAAAAGAKAPQNAPGAAPAPDPGGTPENSAGSQLKARP